MINFKKCENIIENLITLTEKNFIEWENCSWSGCNKTAYRLKNHEDILVSYYYGVYDNTLMITLKNREIHWAIVRTYVENSSGKNIYQTDDCTLILEEAIFPRLNYLNFLLSNQKFSKNNEFQNFIHQKLLLAKCIDSTLDIIQNSDIL